ncbi:MAG: hypothetical protein WBD31_29025 [Rubripirellula sp.]
MTINIIDRGNLLDSDGRKATERRLLFALSRFDSRIRQVDLVVKDENGPRGGIDKSCRISVLIDHAADVVVSDKDSDLCRCISRAAERAGRAVSRTVAKSNDFARSRPTFIDPEAITQT